MNEAERRVRVEIEKIPIGEKIPNEKLWEFVGILGDEVSRLEKINDQLSVRRSEFAKLGAEIAKNEKYAAAAFIIAIVATIASIARWLL